MSEKSIENNLLNLTLTDGLALSVTVDGKILLLLLVLVSLGAIYLFANRGYFKKIKSLEIDTAEFGVNGQKVTLKPNDTDKTIAYKIWVELSTRKIGLEIDFEDDVIIEIYDSWFTFFSVTRELIKDVPASKFSRAETEAIIRLSMDVLNDGIRPHLTKWQARFRHWYEQKLEKSRNDDVSPQDLQQQYPHYEELRDDLIQVNQRLIKYRERMHQLIAGPK